MSPQALNQSKRKLVKEASNWSSNLSKSSKVRQLHSFQIHHIKHNGTKFQMLDECFPNQFPQPKRKSATNLERTHKIPKVIKTKLHKRWTFPQCSIKWSTVSPQQQQISQQIQNSYSANYHPWESYPNQLSKQKKRRLDLQGKTTEEEPHNLW